MTEQKVGMADFSLDHCLSFVPYCEFRRGTYSAHRGGKKRR